MSRSSFPALPLAALSAVGALLLSSCGGSSNGAASAGPSGTPTPSTSVAVPSGTKLTAPGTKLSFGQNATVAHEEGKQGTVLGLKVLSAKQGALSDFRGFNLDDPYKRHGSYYYVRVAVTNRGKSTVGGTPVPLWGVSGKNTLLQAVQFTSSFKKCPTKRLPTTFAPGDHFHTCLVYLSPNKGSLAAVSYRPTESYVPIEWHGTVETLKDQKAHKKAAGKHAKKHATKHQGQ